MWYRIFGRSPEMPTEEAIRTFLSGGYGTFGGTFAADDSGWYRADLVVDGVSLQLERYLPDEPGIRAELNSLGGLARRTALPRRSRSDLWSVLSRQLNFSPCAAKDRRAVARVCLACAGFWPRRRGVYQIDGSGILAWMANCRSQNKAERWRSRRFVRGRCGFVMQFASKLRFSRRQVGVDHPLGRGLVELFRCQVVFLLQLIEGTIQRR